MMRCDVSLLYEVFEMRCKVVFDGKGVYDKIW
jgi:hypothetical protein